MSPAQNLIATIAATIRPGDARRSRSTTGGREEERLFAGTGPGSDVERGNATEVANYGCSSLWPDESTEAAQKARHHTGTAGKTAGHDPTLSETDDQDEPLEDRGSVWRGAEAQGMGGNGGVDEDASTKGDIRPRSGRASRALTTTPYLTLALEQVLLLPLVILLCLSFLLILAHYAWPPIQSHPGGGGQGHVETYPHPFAWRPFTLGAVFALAARSLRTGIGVAVRECFGPSRDKEKKPRRLAVIVISISMHTIILEMARLAILPIMFPLLSGHVSVALGGHSPSTSSLLQAAFHAGIGFGASEAGWGVAHGWSFGLLPYKNVLSTRADLQSSESVIRRVRSLSSASSAVEDETWLGGRQSAADEAGRIVTRESAPEDGRWETDDDAESESGDQELASKIEALERMRARADLESVLGMPYPNIDLAIHVLWRLDTILINLGLTLLVAAFYYDPEPLYRRHGPDEMPTASDGILKPSRWLPLVAAAIIVLHTGMNLAWSLAIRRVGLGSMTWGSLIVSLMSLFAGLGW